MAKPQKKGKGPRRSNGGQGLDENALSQITAKIDKNLSANENNKRKKPPTNTVGEQQNKRQRNSDGPASKKGLKISKEDLLAEIKALGGDEKDLDLINDIDSSDDEYVKESKTPVDKKLRDELAAFSKELGFAEHVPSEASEDEKDGAQDDNEEEDDEDEDDEDEEGEEAEEGEDADDVVSGKIAGLTFQPRADWHVTKLASLPSPTTDQLGQYMGAVTALKQHARTLLDADSARYRTSVFASSSHKFLSTIMTSGTLTDKVSALTLAVQESPVHNIRAFDALMTLAAKKSRAQAIGAIGALVDLLGPGTLLPPQRRLRAFQTQPGLLGTLERNGVKSWAAHQPLPGKITENHLISWCYEDWLKETFFKMIQLLEVWCSDEIDYSRSRAIDLVYGLLKEKPEQEANLMRLLVNKLGDRSRKIASRASYLLLQLQNQHPGMKPVIVRTIEQEILLRPGQDHRTKYYAITTLNQTILSSKEPAVAEALVRIYFDLFVIMLKAGNLGIPTQSESDVTKAPENSNPKARHRGKRAPAAAPEPETEAADKLVSAILTGVNRAAPFVGAHEAIMENHIDTLFRIAHSANFNTGIQALLLIQHLSSSRNMASDRFYRTLYESLLDPRLATSSKQALYLNLLLRALKNDVDVRRVKAFVKRMLQVTAVHQPPFICGVIYILSHLRKTFPDLSTLIDQPEESIFDDDDESAPRPVYDGRKRNPEHSNAQRSCLWELIPIQSHFHPSVHVLASALLERDSEVKKPDMDSHSLIRFLDKFVYRNPKATDGSRGTSIMQPVKAPKDLGDVWLGSRGTGAGASAAALNTPAFWNKKAGDVAAEDVFFHEYFQHVAKEPKTPAKKAASTGEDDEEDEQEDEIWKALVSAQPDVEGEGSDMGFDDLDEDDMASEDGSSPALSLDSDMDDDLDLESGDEDEDGDEMEGLVAAEDGEEEDSGEAKSSKEKEKDTRKSRRRALKDLPMFASVDDYAELLAKEEDM
ncbi:CCAAT-box-binding transcription factor [Stachybotrys elegans]|uniref:CCAAT-box-binding transcription factor n=1 Tax=Stachybotrys elegans TaxID=80388 RepID=A0A8K0T588_9HYPO|nr:CCAAT-box-binding transcription factor [Stachybotrys elegans]